MAFRKRNIGISSGSPRTPDSSSSSQPPASQLPGTRSSPLDGRLTTSTGTPTLDSLLAGHAGLVLGNSLIIEETGTTDFAGSLLRYYAAEGVVQWHIVHVVGVGQQWGRTLPGLIGAGEEGGRREKGEKMKIAWRYERLGEFGAVAGARGVLAHLPY
jgi:elongator complex protein 4